MKRGAAWVSGRRAPRLRATPKRPSPVSSPCRWCRRSGPRAGRAAGRPSGAGERASAPDRVGSQTARVRRGAPGRLGSGDRLLERTAPGNPRAAEPELRVELVLIEDALVE